MTRTIQGRILGHFEKDPGRRCIAFVDRRGEFAWRTREQFLGAALSAGGALAERGLGAGDVAVLVSVEPAECATFVLAALMLGAVPLLVAPPAIQGANSSLKEVVLDVAGRTGARLCVLSEDMRKDEAALRAANAESHLEFGWGGIVRAGPSSAQPELRTPEDVAAMQLTSGTTGRPRIAVWKQANVLAALDGMAQAMRVSREDVYLNWTPLYHDMGLVNNFLMSLVQGLPLALLSPLDVVRQPALWLRALDATGATTTWSPNFGFALAAERVKDDELEGVSLSGVRGFWNAAERVHAETLDGFLDRFESLGVRRDSLKTNFGCVETIGGVTFTGAERAPVRERVALGALRNQGIARVVGEGADETEAQSFVSCGRAYGGVDLQVFDDEGNPQVEGRVGELGIRNSAHFSEFLGDPEQTARSVRGEWVFTGDEGYMRNGEFFWTGRLNERINLQGKKYDPSDFERVLFDIPGLRKGCFCAFGLERVERGTEVLILIAEVEPEAEGDSPKLALKVRGAVATQLGVAVEELLLVPKGTLTKTSSGKRRHRHFREWYSAGRLEPIHRSGAGRLG